MTMIFIKGIILSFPKEVVNVYDLGYLEVETDFPEQLSALPCKKKEINEYLKKKKIKHNSFKKEDSGVTYYLQIEKIQDYE